MILCYLQSQIDSICYFSVKWGLEINVDKTKICVFESRKSKNTHKFFIEGREIEIVDSFTYLGIKFYYTGSFNLAIRTLQEQALRAFGTLLQLFDRLPLDIKTKLSLFDSMVRPILLYGAEVWGIYKFKARDKLHIKFLKSLLGVKMQIPNYAVLGEFGRYPLSIICKHRALNFWYKIMSNSNQSLYEAYVTERNENNANNWSNKTCSLIDHLGLTYVRLYYDNNANYHNIFKTRLQDQFIQEWKTSIINSPELSLYCKFKKEFSYMCTSHIWIKQ